MAARKPVHFEADTLDIAQQMLEDKETKKSICEFLGIAYNTKRLGTILDNHEADKLREVELRKQKRRTACTKEEKVSMIEDYLSGDSITKLSESYYRSTSYIRHQLEMAGALLRSNSAKDPLNPPMYPDQGLLLDAEFKEREQTHFSLTTKKEWEDAESSAKAKDGWAAARSIFSSGSKFSKTQAVRLDGELVWVPAYQCLGEVVKEVPSKTDKAFRVLLLDPSYQRNVHVCYWDLCSLRHLVDLGVNVERMGRCLKNDDITSALNEALKAAAKNKSK